MSAAVDAQPDCNGDVSQSQMSLPHINADAVEAPRKPKRSRWGLASDIVAEPKKRRSRWGSEQDKINLTPEMAATSAAMDKSQRELFLLKVRMNDITLKLQNVQALIPADPALRSPSPPPQYDINGKRSNTREMRIRDKLMQERNELIEKNMMLNPMFNAPADFKRQKLQVKLMIPADEPPGPYVEGQPPPRPHSYCGMILGPRGLTQKRMQQETNCKIEIRGRGSQKEGRRHKPHPSDNEDLHVLITGTNEDEVEECKKMIELLLVPINEDNNEHKARQLRELAAINGTLRDEIRCRLCNQTGHFVDRCPERTGGAWNPAVVRCEVCHDRGHLTMDCPTGGSVNMVERTRLTSEYDNFMSELTGAPKRVEQSVVEKQPEPIQHQEAPPPSNSSYGGTGYYGQAPPPPPPAQQQWGQQGQYGVYPPPPNQYGAPQHGGGYGYAPPPPPAAYGYGGYPPAPPHGYGAPPPPPPSGYYQPPPPPPSSNYR